MWVIPLVILMATVPIHFTLPTYSQGPLECEALEGLPATDMSWAYVLGVRRHSSRIDTLLRIPAKGKQGTKISSTVNDSGMIYTIWVVVRDSMGNTSCPSNLLTLGATVEVPASIERRSTYFDLQGRRVQPPLTPGIYWVVSGAAKPRKVVVIR